MVPQGPFTETPEASGEHRHRLICAACLAPLDSLPLVKKAALTIPEMEAAACPQCMAWLSSNLMIDLANCEVAGCEAQATITRLALEHDGKGCEDCYGMCSNGGCHCAPLHDESCDPDCVNECPDCDMALDTPESIALWAARNRQWAEEAA